MESSSNPYLAEDKTGTLTVRNVIFWICLLILLSLSIILFFYIRDGLKNETTVIAGTILSILTAMELNRRNHTEISGGIIALVLTIMLTIMATLGQGIHDIGIMAYPSILIIASLILRKEIIIYLTVLMIACNGWLIFGENYGVFEPVYPDQGNLRHFIITISILVITAVAVQLISNIVRSSLVTTNQELHERKKIEKSLRETETLYRTLVEQTSVVTYRDFPDVNGATIYISPQIETLLGYSLNEWQENPTIWKRLTHPDDLPKVLAEIENYIASGKRTKIEYRMQALDGQWIWVQDESIVIKDDSGTPQYVHGVLIDITERKQAEEKVQQREAILSSVAFTAQQLLKESNWREEIQGILARLGEATRASHVYIFENHPGTDGSALSSQKYEWVAPGIKPDMDNPVYQNSRLSPSPGLEDWYANLSTGIPFYGSGKQYPRYWKRVFDERGVKTLLDVPIFVNDQWWGIIGFDDYVNEMPWSQAEIDALVAAAGNLGVAIERQQSDKALRASEEKFQLAFHRTFVPMVISRAHDQIILDVNEAFCKGAGYSRDEAVGKTAVELNLWANQEDQLKHEAVLAKQGYAGEFKAEFRRKSGETGVALISAIMILLGEEPCFLHTVYDISKIDQLVNELRTKNEELQNFTYTVSHDLKAPLITISGFLGYLEEDAQKGDLDKVRKDSLRINEAVAKMQRLLSELLELSRIGRLMNLPQNVPFGDIVQEALRLVEGRLEANQVKVQVEAGLPNVNGDRVRLVEVVQNLVDNAAKFMGDQKNPTIEIGTITENDETVFLVRDNGIGIEPEQHERIFGLFNKLDTHSDGTGIGLTLVKRIVDVHGGKIWLESGVGKGTTFFFTLDDKNQQEIK